MRDFLIVFKRSFQYRLSRHSRTIVKKNSEVISDEIRKSRNLFYLFFINGKFVVLLLEKL